MCLEGGGHQAEGGADFSLKSVGGAVEGQGDSRVGVMLRSKPLGLEVKRSVFGQCAAVMQCLEDNPICHNLALKHKDLARDIIWFLFCLNYKEISKRLL